MCIRDSKKGDYILINDEYLGEFETPNKILIQLKDKSFYLFYEDLDINGVISIFWERNRVGMMTENHNTCMYDFNQDGWVGTNCSDNIKDGLSKYNDAFYDYIEAVSYTHLDVYKRQLIID